MNMRELDEAKAHDRERPTSTRRTLADSVGRRPVAWLVGVAFAAAALTAYAIAWGTSGGSTSEGGIALSASSLSSDLDADSLAALGVFQGDELWWGTRGGGEETCLILVSFAEGGSVPQQSRTCASAGRSKPVTVSYAPTGLPGITNASLLVYRLDTTRDGVILTVETHDCGDATVLECANRAGV